MEDVSFGVCRLSLIPVRSEPSHRSEQVTQLLFGDHYEVIALDKEWVRIKIFADHYEGWIDIKQHHTIGREYFEYLNRAEFKITTDLTSGLLYNKNPILILLGSLIPITSTELFRMEEQFAFNGEAKNMGQKRDFEFLRQIAIKYLHVPYQWGGKSPFGIDCSGFTQMVFRICGYPLLRDSGQQATQGKPVGSIETTAPGDLAFFQNKEGKVTHVGIVMPERRVIHASGRVRIDGLAAEGIISSETNQLTHQTVGFRRILNEGQSAGQ